MSTTTTTPNKRYRVYVNCFLLCINKHVMNKYAQEEYFNAWQHEAITWTNVELSSVRCASIHLRAFFRADITMPINKTLASTSTNNYFSTGRKCWLPWSDKQVYLHIHAISTHCFSICVHAYAHSVPLNNMFSHQSELGLVITPYVSCGMKLLIHSQT